MIVVSMGSPREIMIFTFAVKLKVYYRAERKMKIVLFEFKISHGYWKFDRL